MAWRNLPANGWMLLADRFSWTFLVRNAPLVFQSSSVGGFGRFGFLAFLWCGCDRQNQLSQLLQTIGNITTLISKAVAGYQQCALLVDPAKVLFLDSQSQGIVNAGAVMHAPPQRYLCIQFIDVLATRATWTYEFLMQFRFINRYGCGNFYQCHKNKYSGTVANP